MALTSDKELFDIFENEEIESHIDDIILRSLAIKKSVVEQDEREAGLRKVLNFGHTVGHGMESSGGMSELYHGECVALGMVAAAYISKIKGHLSSDDLHMIETANAVYGLPVRFHGIINQTVLENLSHDKKKEGEKVKFILLEKLGTCYSSTDVTTEEINHAINYLKEGTN
jgi:3-dehydroquinate synthase